MRILLCITFALILLLALLCAGAVAYGRSQPTPNIFADVGIDDCACVPCLHGVIPGVTSWEEAKQKLASYADGISANAINIGLGSQVEIGVQPLNALVKDITVLNYNDPTRTPSLRRLIATYGYPCQVEFVRSYFRTEIDLIYPTLVTQTFISDMNGDVVLDESFVLWHIAFQPFSPCVLQKNDPKQNNGQYFTPWLGLRSISYYLNYRD